MDVNVFVAGATEHSKGHGQEVSDNIWKFIKRPVAESMVQPETRVVHAHEMSFAVALAPPKDEQIMQARDVAIDATQSWRGGLGAMASVTDLETKVANLASAELVDYKLSWRLTSNGAGLFTNNSLREGDVVCPVSALWTWDMHELKKICPQTATRP